MDATQSKTKNFVFRKNQIIGAADAVNDARFLYEAFVDTGELEILSDVSDHRSVVVGRTGTGKSALLVMLERTHERVVRIAPGDVAVNHIANSSTLRFFADAGVKLDLFYTLLWRHVLAVEIIRKHYNIVNEQARDAFRQKMEDRFSRNKTRQDAIKYLLELGDSFWLESDHRIREVTSKLEHKLETVLTADLKGKIPVLGEIGFGTRTAPSVTLTTEEKAEIVRYGQPVVEDDQMRRLGHVIELIENDMLVDEQKRYYITIDRLDENWVNDDLRYHLIKALIDTVYDFNGRIANLKIVVAIREDLLERVFRYARGSGHQEEKYRSMYVGLRWRAEDLEAMLDKRVQQLVKDQYTTGTVTVRDLLPNSIGKMDSVDYILSRTFLRPRDAIEFLNACIAEAVDKPLLTQEIVQRGEADYSEHRIGALADEWDVDYPNLRDLLYFLKGMPSQFTAQELAATMDQKLLEFLVRPQPRADYIYELAHEKFNRGDHLGFVLDALLILFKVSAIGVKAEAYTGVRWSYQGHKLLREEISEEASIHVHPALWRGLGIRPIQH